MKKKIMNKEEYQNLLIILNSKDDESVALGLITLDSYDYNTNIVYIKLLLKKSSIDKNILEKNAPKIFKKKDNNLITFNDIWLEIKKQEPTKDKEEVILFLEEWNNFLLQTLLGSGCEFIKDLTIKIEFNGELK